MPKSLFQDIYRDIRNDIEHGLYSYQSLLLSENEMCKQYGCSRSTVRRALAELARDGFVQPIQGKGVRVIWRPETDDQSGYAMGGLESFCQTGERLGFEAVNLVRSFEVLTVDEHLAQVTGFAEGDEIYRINRVRFADKFPVSIETSYLLKSEAPDLTPEIAEKSLYRHLEEDLGIGIATGKRIITVEAANDDDMIVFGLDKLPAVGVLRGQHFDTNGVMFEYSEIRQHPYYFSVRETASRPVVSPTGQVVRNAESENATGSLLYKLNPNA